MVRRYNDHIKTWLSRDHPRNYILVNRCSYAFMQYTNQNCICSP